jgi:hypothetical protein
MANTVIEGLRVEVRELAEVVRGLNAEINRMKTAPAAKRSAARSKNGRPDVCCFICGGENAEIQHTGDGRLTVVCRDCKAVYRVPMEILRKPDHGVLCRLGLVDTCLGLCGDKDDADDKEMIKTGKPPVKK